MKYGNDDNHITSRVKTINIYDQLLEDIQTSNCKSSEVWLDGGVEEIEVGDYLHFNSYNEDNLINKVRATSECIFSKFNYF